MPGKLGDSRFLTPPWLPTTIALVMPPDDSLFPPYRVLDLTDEKGVFCTKLLADYGADVIRVEPPSGDPGRTRGPFLSGDPHQETSAYFLFYNTNKRSITLDLKTGQGQTLLKQLAAKSDVVVESLPVGYLKRLGLDYDSLREANPGLVMASISPFGQNGPWKDYKSTDLIAMAASGYMQITGEPDQPPVRQGNEQSHFPGAQYAAVAIMAALYYRDMLSGEGQYIDVSLQEALITYYTDAHPALAWQQLGQNVTRVGTNSTLVIPLGAFPCKDGWISAGVITPREWDTLAAWIHEVTGNDEILSEQYRGGNQERAPHIDIITALFVDFTSRFTADELFHEGQKRNLVFLPVNDVSELLQDPQLEASHLWTELDHPVVGALKYPLGVFDSEEVAPSRAAAPLLGQDNQSIYCAELGLTVQELAALRAEGVI
ncbi:MAG: CoA transferase [Chloroflexi bacterium]|nr:CoA transferase [Chloroflexota bacterium]